MVLDFETRWDSKEYTLSKLTTEQYIRHEKFKAFGMCYKFYGEETTRWVPHSKLQEFFDSVEWSTTAVLAHNAQFDVSILSMVYGHQPCFIFDSLSMARALRGVEVGNSLMKLAQDFELPPKGKAVHSTDGLDELTPQIEYELAEYCKHDVFLCEEIFKRLVEGYPAKELRLIDMTLRMFTNPLLVLDKDMLEKAIEEELVARTALLAKLGIDESQLASNPQFAEILTGLGVTPPTKISKTTGKRTLALAKNDAHFQALLNSEREDVALLCETRLAVKSTLDRTRAQRFLDIAQRGTLPVPLNYYGAHTGRWSASKGSGINMQNLRRKSFLRKAIVAPAGCSLVVCDLAQIEPRVLAHLTDYSALLNIFRSGEDAYAQFGAQMFGIPGLTKESHPALRQSAKSALLGCFGADTLVLTKRGWIPIVQVLVTDTVWDGIEWVKHQGLAPQGEKEVLTSLGVSATTDHEIMTEHGWAAWSEVLASPSLLKSALLLVNLPASGGSANPTAPNGKGATHTSHVCDVLVGGKVLSNAPIFGAVEQPDVTLAQKRKPQGLVWWQRAMCLCAQTESTAIGYSTVSAQSLFVALTRKVKSIPTMAVEASRYTLHGLKTVLRSCATWLGFPVGIYRLCSLTASTITVDTCQTTYASLHVVKTGRTSDRTVHERLKPSIRKSQFLKQKMQTYDIAYAGPRNRYTILTNEGPLVVHNCGYGLGWASFSAQLLTGFLGAPPTRYDKTFAKQLGVSSEYLISLLQSARNLERMGDIPRTCTEQELVIHCASAKFIIDSYRAAATPVSEFWSMCDKLLIHSLIKGNDYKHKCLTFTKGKIILPSGLALRYPALKGVPDEKGRVQWVYGPDEKKLYGGKLTENIVQAVARCVMTDGMLRIQKRYPCALTVHDEVVVIVPDSEAVEAENWTLAQMTMEPKYMPGIPLDADAGHAKRYGDAK